jgi:hypothetical protein
MTCRAALLACVVLVAACGRTKPPASRKPSSSRSQSATPAAANPWDEALGAVVATPSLDGAAPVAFLRDSAGVADLDVELLNHDDRASRGTLHPRATDRTCAWRRAATLTTGDGHAVAANSWSLALAPGIAAPFGVDGIAELTPRDSAALVARISRLVSAIPEDSLSSQFHGLPVVVRDAWRVRLADSLTITVAIAARSLNIESNPSAESTTLIAEPDSSAGAGELRTAYWERESGPEDRVEGADLLAAFQLRRGPAAMALVRGGDGGPQVEIVERASRGAWQLRWSTATLPCAQP